MSAFSIRKLGSMGMDTMYPMSGRRASPKHKKSLSDPEIGGAAETLDKSIDASNLAKMMVSNPRFSLGSIDIPKQLRRPKQTQKKHWTFGSLCPCIGRRCAVVARKCFGDGDWILLTVLGLGMGLLSFAMDDCIERIVWARQWLYSKAGHSVGVQFVCWTGSKLILALISAWACLYIAPQATGSGLPEMKTILRGVALREYLTWKTLITKAVALTLCLGSGIPIGKEGPFVHICSIMATVLMKWMSSFRKGYKNENVRMDMLAAACAVGVACTFGAPIGGVLFSIEVTSVYFAVRNYWRGFFAATCSAILFRLAMFWFGSEASPLAFSQTNFSAKNPYHPDELIVYMAIGVICGVTSPLFTITHRRMVVFLKENTYARAVFGINKLLYTTCVIIVISTLTFPGGGPGQFTLSAVSPRSALSDFFLSNSWQNNSQNSSQLDELVRRWTPLGVSFYITLACYALCTFITSCLANTLPIPTGVFIPTFVIGAAFGRLVGEFLYMSFPRGIFWISDGVIVPGSYALVAAAAFTGGVTHTISISVIVFELTGQIVYMLPVMIACLISNFVSTFINPSFFENIILTKGLPYLPDMLPVESKLHTLVVKQFMTPVDDMKYVSLQTTIGRIREILYSLPRVKTFPLVDTATSKILLGSIPRSELQKQIEYFIGDKARQRAAKKLKSLHDDEKIVESILSAHERRLIRGRGNKCASDGNLALTGRRRGAIVESTGLRQDLERLASRHSDVDLSGAQNEDAISASSPTESAKRRALTRLITGMKRRRLSLEHSSDCTYMTDRERTKWESVQLAKKLVLHRLHIDSAPIRLIEHTSLHKCHSLFSLLSLQCAYVTRMGRLVGVVTLSDVRRALQTAPPTNDDDNEDGAAAENCELAAAEEADEDNNGAAAAAKRKQKKSQRHHKASEGLIAVALKPFRERKMGVASPSSPYLAAAIDGGDDRPPSLATIHEGHVTRLWC